MTLWSGVFEDESAAPEHRGEIPGSVLGGVISGGIRHHGERILVDDPEHPASCAFAQTAVIRTDEGRESVSSPFEATRLVGPPPTSPPKRPQSAPDSSRIDALNRADQRAKIVMDRFGQLLGLPS